MAVVALLVYERFSRASLPAGFLMLMTTTIFLSSTMLMVVGLIGEYVGRVLLNISGKPQFVVRRVETGPENRIGNVHDKSEETSGSRPQ